MIWFERPACQADIGAAGCLRAEIDFDALRVCNSLALWVIRSFRGLWLSQNRLISSSFPKDLLKPPIKSRITVKPQRNQYARIAPEILSIAADQLQPFDLDRINHARCLTSLRFSSTIETSRDQIGHVLFTSGPSNNCRVYLFSLLWAFTIIILNFQNNCFLKHLLESQVHGITCFPL